MVLCIQSDPTVDIRVTVNIMIPNLIVCFYWLFLIRYFTLYYSMGPWQPIGEFGYHAWVGSSTAKPDPWVQYHL